MLALALAAASAGAAAPPTWKPVSVERHAGTVAATLSYQRRSTGEGFFRVRRMQLVVAVGSKTVFSRSLCTPGRCGPGSQHSLKLQNVWGGSLNEAVIGLYTGGAHCCFVSLVVLVDGTHPGRLLEHNWGDPGYRSELHDGTFDFVSADDRFAYEFTSFAGSALPVQVWAIDRTGRFAEVTSTRLDLVRADAKQLWRAYVSQRGKAGADVRGVVAGWCADEYRLGQGTACETALASAEQAGYLGGDNLWPRNHAFVKGLEHSLSAWGYRG